jgi:hypothetical protein
MIGCYSNTLCSRDTVNFVSGRIRYRVSTDYFAVNDDRPPIKRSGANNASGKSAANDA